MTLSQQKIWTLVETELKGTENQCLGVAHHLKNNFEHKTIDLPYHVQLCAPYLNFGLGKYMQETLPAPYPDILIAAGRKAIAPALWIKKQSKGKTFTVFLQDPKSHYHQFDLISMPKHDGVTGTNIIHTIGSPNKISAQLLNNEKAQFPQLGTLPSPRIAVLVGGTSKTHRFSVQDAQILADRLTVIAESSNAQMMVTASRRTGTQQTKILRNTLDNGQHFFWPNEESGTGPNPMIAMLGWSDKVIVTGDSVSMISEAASTGKPTYIVPIQGSSSKFDRFYTNVIGANAARWLRDFHDPWDNTPLTDTQMVASMIKERYLTM